MSVQDIRFKLILCLCMIFPPLLLSYSSAFPDLYFYDNFLVGQSPYTVDTDDFGQGSDADSTTWEDYFPSLTNEYSNLLTGLVTTFNNKTMSGTSIPSAVPLVNVDVLVGRSWVLEPGQCQVIYSKAGQYERIYSDSNDYTVCRLGTTMPIGYDSNDGYALKSDGTIYNTPGYANSFNINHFNSNFSKLGALSSLNLKTGIAGADTSLSPYAWSYVLLVYNKGSNDVTFWVNYGDSNAPEIDVPSIALTSVHWILTVCHTESYTDPIGSRVSVIPHINGNINIYSFPYANVLNDSQEDAFYMHTYYDREYTVTYQLKDYSSGYFVFSNGSNFNTLKGSNIKIPLDYISSLMKLDLYPVFLDDSFFQAIYPKALYIRNGYIDITNYDTLVDKLIQAGIGGGDLSQIVALLEQINSGGDTGQAVSELMNILDSYHDNIVGTGDTDWSIINNQFDLYKSLLDFSGETIHWIVTANNALFNYFSGFIILCAFFLIIDRIIRG